MKTFHYFQIVAFFTVLCFQVVTMQSSSAVEYSAATSPKVVTTYGPITGIRENGISLFKGIRYGADTAPNRFEPPTAPASHTDIQHMSDYGASCPQLNHAFPTSEDCLFLNVWTPDSLDEAQSTAARPVLFYIHGGAYAHGSGSNTLYDGTNIAKRGDIVVVTVNHRLNLFGYAYFGLMNAPSGWKASGNAGQLDLILALEWVKNNIHQFGGDPNNITVAGQSGGGAKIATMMAMPAAKDLFHKALTMSGQQVTASGPKNATARTDTWLKALGLTRDQLSDLKTIPAGKLLEAAQAYDPILAGKRLYWGPVMDMVSLHRHPFYPDASPQSAHIPMILGNTHDETRAFLSGNPKNLSMSWEELPALLAPQLPVDIHPVHVVNSYRALYPALSPSEIFFKATTAGRSWRGQVIEAEERAKQGGPTWVYQLDWQSPKDGGKWHAPHTLDIPFLFDTTSAPNAISGDSEDAREMAKLFGDFLFAFMRTGNPNTESLPSWPEYTLEDRATMLMNLPPKLALDPRGAERRLFEAVQYVQPGS